VALTVCILFFHYFIEVVPPETLNQWLSLVALEIISLLVVATSRAFKISLILFEVVLFILRVKRGLSPGWRLTLLRPLQRLLRVLRRLMIDERGGLPLR
jgi:hypothetical protein